MSMEAGATGLIFGRNVWQREHVESLWFAAALRETSLSTGRHGLSLTLVAAKEHAMALSTALPSHDQAAGPGANLRAAAGDTLIIGTASAGRPRVPARSSRCSASTAHRRTESGGWRGSTSRSSRPVPVPGCGRVTYDGEAPCGLYGLRWLPDGDGEGRSEFPQSPACRSRSAAGWPVGQGSRATEEAGMAGERRSGRVAGLVSAGR